MGRPCVICAREDRDAIDAALVEGAAFRDVSRRFPGVSKDAAARHKATHIRASVVDAAARARAEDDEHRADSLLDKVRALEERARSIARRAEAAGDLRVALSGVRELTRIVELQAKLVGELDEAPTINVSIGSEWPALRGTILSALEPHAAAREAVARALAEAPAHG
jgi:hypothetical protein